MEHNEFFLDRISQISSSNGVVHLQVTTLCPEDGYIDIEVNARELLNDIPSLHYCTKAIKEENNYLKEKYIKFKKTLK